MNHYLKPNVAIEPLFCSWYLWGYLIPPHTAGYFIKNRYLKMMNSFLENPELHRAAAKNSKLAGGQFIDLDDNGLKKLQSLAEITEKEACLLINLASDIAIFDELLQAEGDGRSLEYLYQSIPNSLKGCIELVYDHHNHPKIHFFEKILYEKYYDRSLQSVLLSPLQGDRRKFSLSTPRIASENELSLPLNFNHSLLAMIVQSRWAGLNLDMVYGTLSLDMEQQKLLQGLFTTTAPMLPITPLSAPFNNGEIRVSYFGHACVLIETEDVSILVDPCISYFRPENGIDRLTLDALPDSIDYVLFSHNHLDHILFETLLFMKHKVKHFVFQQSGGGTLLNPSLKLQLEALGFNNLFSVDYLEEVIIPGGRLFSYPFLGEHGDLDIQSKSAFYIEIFGHKFLFLADSNNFENGLYEYLYEKTGPIDTVFIGMECMGGPLDWIYGPLLSPKITYMHKQSRRYSGSDSRKALLKLVRTLQAREVFVYAMGQEAWLSHIMGLNYESTSPQIMESEQFISACRDINIPCRRLNGGGVWQYQNTTHLFHGDNFGGGQYEFVHAL